MYQCNQCGAKFAKPKTISDDVGDEEYDECPRCGGEDFETIKPNIFMLIEKHERALELLEMVQGLKRRIEVQHELIKGFSGTFPSLRKKYLNRIDTLNRGIDRLINYYNKKWDTQ